MQYPSKSVEFTVQPKNSPVQWTAEELTKHVEEVWCRRSPRAGRNDLWLETTAGKHASKPTAGTHHLALCMVSLGAFTSPGRYVCHWKSQRTKAHSGGSHVDSLDYLDINDYDDIERNVSHSALMAGFEYDNDVVTVSWTESASLRWRMEVAFDSVADGVVLVASDGATTHLYLFLVNQPRLYRGAPQQRRFIDFDEDVDTVWERDVTFGSCDRHIIGSSSAVHLEIDPQESGKIDGLLKRLVRHEFSIYVGSPTTVEAAGNAAIQWPRFAEFEASYAWYCLTSRGFKVTDQVSGDVVNFLQEQEDEALVARLLYAVGDHFDNNCVASLSTKSLRRKWDALLQYRDTDDEEERRQMEHLVKVRRLLLTPTAVRALPGEHIVGNRVVREFGVDGFLRVVLRDEDMELLSASAVALDKPVRVITEFLRQDLTIGNRRYHFLGCSNSQMRQHGFWMYASDGRQTVDGIRRWMGDLSGERCVATYVSRLGQFFSASKKTISVDERFKRLIPDVTRNDYCFTDGVGMISSSLSQKVRTNMRRIFLVPSVGRCNSVTNR